jgi:hypothetical protein
MHRRCSGSASAGLRVKEGISGLPVPKLPRTIMHRRCSGSASAVLRVKEETPACLYQGPQELLWIAGGVCQHLRCKEGNLRPACTKVPKTGWIVGSYSSARTFRCKEGDSRPACTKTPKTVSCKGYCRRRASFVSGCNKIYLNVFFCRESLCLRASRNFPGERMSPAGVFG